MHPEFGSFSDEQVDAVVRPLLDELGLPPSYCISIRSLVRSRAQNWRSCCGGNCTPCIGMIEEAVDRSRQILLALGPEFAPEDATGDTASPGEGEVPEDRNWGIDYA